MKCIIVDDEPIARKGMRRLEESRPDLELTATLDSAVAAISFLENNDVDLIFLDIEMPEVSGIELSRKIHEDCMVIFTTAYSEYALESYEVEAIDYLVKPIEASRFNKAVDKASAYKKMIDDARQAASVNRNEMDFMIVKADRKYMRIRFDDITFIEGLKDYLLIHLSDRRVLTRLTIKSAEETLPSHKFLRVSKSYIVNIDRIDAFTNNDIYIGETEIAIGISYKESVISRLLTQ